jgi:hypothetical protein
LNLTRSGWRRSEAWWYKRITMEGRAHWAAGQSLIINSTSLVVITKGSSEAQYASSRSFTGDHLDAYAIEITHVEVDELTAKGDDFEGPGYRGDQLPKVLDDAVAFVGSSLGSHEIQWFPLEKVLRSPEFYVYRCTIYCHGILPTAVELIFV